jgi:hypothetical protein
MAAEGWMLGTLVYLSLGLFLLGGVGAFYFFATRERRQYRRVVRKRLQEIASARSSHSLAEGGLIRR